MSPEAVALAEPVIGFRAWRVQQGELVALGGERWPVGDHVAHCRGQRRHAVPAKACGCGLYGWHQPPDELPGSSIVIGAVVAWGRLRIHADGFRAQYARPIVLATGFEDKQARLDQVARRYQIPVVAPRELALVASEFGRVIPLAERPLELGDLLARVCGSIAARESLRSSADLLSAPNDRYGERVLALHASRADLPLVDALRIAAEHPGQLDELLEDWAEGIQGFRRATLDALTRDERVEGRRLPTQVLLRALDVSHGLTISQAHELMSTQAAPGLPSSVLLHPDLLRLDHPASRLRARELLASDKRFIDYNPVLTILDELSEEEIIRHTARLRSSGPVAEVLAAVGDRAPTLARALLANRCCVAHVATEVLGRRARPLLLRQLARDAWQFELGFGERLREIVGDQALRLAAERELRDATDPVLTIGALALLPEGEAREPLNRVLERVNRLRHPEPRFRIYERAWNVTCSRGLAELLEPALVEHVLSDQSQPLINHIMVLKAHPTTVADHAARIWMRPGIPASWALDALLAAGPRRARLAREAFARPEAAITDRGAAARLAAALAAENRDDPTVRRITRSVATDERFPATLRALGAWLSGHRPARADGRPHDPVLDRYEAWLARRAPTLEDPLAELLRAGWLQNTLPDGSP
jgi:hypothetical protein